MTTPNKLQILVIIAAVFGFGSAYIKTTRQEAHDQAVQEQAQKAEKDALVKAKETLEADLTKTRADLTEAQTRLSVMITHYNDQKQRLKGLREHKPEETYVTTNHIPLRSNGPKFLEELAPTP